MAIVSCGGSQSSLNTYGLSISHLKTLNTGLLLYGNDYDDVLPVAGHWMDAVVPYVKDEAAFHSPNAGTRGYGYALNTNVQGQSIAHFSTPSTVITLFDSTDLSRNATDPTSTEPKPPRYGAKNTIAYLDGHVQDENEAQGAPAPYQQSRSNLKQVDLGMLMYANDYDDALPLANRWMDELTPYVKNSTLFQSPAVVAKNPNAYGYAMNQDIAGKFNTSFASPSTTLSFFDSTVLTRNATAGVATLPQPPRYGKANTQAFVDGHVQP